MAIVGVVDWDGQAEWLSAAFKDLAESASTTIVPVLEGADNLAITGLEFVSGVLREDTVARYRATVRNFGSNPVANVQVKGLADDITVDTKTIPTIAPGASETLDMAVAGGGQYALVLAGDTQANGTELSRHSCAFRFPDETPAPTGAQFCR